MGRLEDPTVTDYKIHPAADLFPMLGEEKLVTLKNSIIASGQHFPIITWNGHIIDGRNRLKACQMAGIKPKFKAMDFAGETAAVTYIISTNLTRRHLTTSQRAMIASELAKLERADTLKQNRDVDGSIDLSATQTDAAKALSVSPASVKRARAVAKADPALAEKVKAGEVTLNAAHKQVQKPKTPPSSPLYIPPDPCEEPDLPPELPGDKGEPAKLQSAPSQRAMDLLAAAMELSDFDRGWLAAQLVASR